MGTSNRSKGPGNNTPLIPSFLNDPPAQPAIPKNGSPIRPASQPQTPASEQPLPPIPQVPVDRRRFTSARSNFTRFARNRDEGSLRKAIGNYVTRGAGGRHGAMRRMGSSRQTARNLAGFIRSTKTVGTESALRSLGLERCIGRPTEEVLQELLEVMCPDGGRIDEGIAREAFQNAIVDLAQQDLPPIEELTVEQWNVLLIDFLVRSIELRLIADIGERSLDVPESIERFCQAEEVMRNVIYATVRDVVGDMLDRLSSISESQLQRATDQAYERAWGAFEAFASDEQ